MWHVTGDMWQVTGDRRHVTGDEWQVTDDRWQVIGDRWQMAGNRWQVTGDRWPVTGKMWKVTGDIRQVTGDSPNKIAWWYSNNCLGSGTSYSSCAWHRTGSTEYYWWHSWKKLFCPNFLILGLKILTYSTFEDLTKFHKLHIWPKKIILPLRTTHTGSNQTTQYLHNGLHGIWQDQCSQGCPTNSAVINRLTD